MRAGKTHTKTPENYSEQTGVANIIDQYSFNFLQLINHLELVHFGVRELLLGWLFLIL